MVLSLIALFSLASYFVGTRAVLQGRYKPNVYSRIVWFLLAANALAGLIRLGNGSDTIALSALQTCGSLLILFASLKYSIFSFGFVEKVSSFLLLVSLMLWLVGNYPILNVSISLVAHFIAGIPTIRAVIKNASSENIMFWAYFAVASALALYVSDKSSYSHYMFSLYFLAYNSMMVVLATRKHMTRKVMQPIEM